jgi:hypothetical protein
VRNASFIKNRSLQIVVHSLQLGRCNALRRWEENTFAVRDLNAANYYSHHAYCMCKV